MKLPHRVVFNSKLPGFFGRIAIGRPFTAWTFAYLTFLPGSQLPSHQVWVHEHEHVRQFFAGCLTGLILWLCFSRSLWTLPLIPFTFSFAYAGASFAAWVRGKHPYRDNLFEVEARNAAGEK